MGVRRRVFVSHSSRTESARDLLSRFVGALGAGSDPVDVLWDGGVIEPGDSWREKLDWMLYACDAAVLLLTPDALESNWVRREAANLCWGRERLRGFRVFPVLWDDGRGRRLTRADIKGHPDWSAISIPEIEFLRDGEPEELAESVKRAVAKNVSGYSTLDVLAADIAGEFDDIPEERLWASLDCVPDDLVIDRRRPHPLAATLARWFLSRQPPALREFARVLNRLGPTMAPNRSLDLLDRLYPLWVAPEAAGWMRRVREPDAPVAALVLRCERPDVVEPYLGRAYFLENPPRPFILNVITPAKTLGESVDSAVQELREAARERYLLPAWYDDKKIDDTLQDPDVLTYVVLALPVDTDFIDEIHCRLPGVTFIYYSNNPASAERKSLPMGLGWITPQHETGIEEQARLDHERAAVVIQSRRQPSSGWRAS